MPNKTAHVTYFGRLARRLGQALSLTLMAGFAQADVTPSGAFSHQYSFDLPDAPQAVKPGLGLGYHSSSLNNGPVGIGWTLSGFSSIERVNDGTGFDFGDKNLGVFTGPDGRLVDISSENDEYRPENGTQKRYHAQFAGEYLTNWVVYDANGGQAHYAYSEKSQYAHYSGSVGTSGNRYTNVRWRLTRYADADGNDYNVIYDKHNYTVYPDKVTYLQTSAGGSDVVTVDYVYLQSRTDNPFTMDLGIAKTLSRHLDYVKITVNGRLYRQYDMEYVYNAGALQLVHIHQKGTDGVVDYSQSAKFDWGINTVGSVIVTTPNGGPSATKPGELKEKVKGGDFDDDETTSPTVNITEEVVGIPILSLPKRSDVARIQYGDFNGDGRQDSYKINDGQHTIYLDNDANGTTWSAAEGVPYGYLQNLGSEPDYCDNIQNQSQADACLEYARKQIQRSTDMGNILIGDFNGDGKDDIYQIAQVLIGPYNAKRKHYNLTYPSSTDRVYLSNGSGFDSKAVPASQSFGNWLASSFVGDHWKRNALVESGLYQSLIKTGDINGDQKTDILRFSTPGTGDHGWIRTSEGASGDNFVFTNYNHTPLVLIDDSGLEAASITVEDFDGDGRSDYMVWSNGNQSYYLSRGPMTDTVSAEKWLFALTTVNQISSSWQGEGETGANAELAAQRMLFGDFNGDGSTDQMYVVPGSTPEFCLRYSVLYSVVNNAKYCNVLSSTSVATGTRSARTMYGLGIYKVTDYNNDGIADLYIVNTSGDASTTDEVLLSDGSTNINNWISVKGATTVAHSHSLLDGGSRLGIWLARYRLLDQDGDGFPAMHFMANAADSAINQAAIRPNNVLLDYNNTRRIIATSNIATGLRNNISYATKHSGYWPDIMDFSSTAPGDVNTSPKVLVKSVMVQDRFAKAGYHTLTTYDYENGRTTRGLQKDRHNLGFATVGNTRYALGKNETASETTEAVTTQTNYNQNYPFNGLPSDKKISRGSITKSEQGWVYGLLDKTDASAILLTDAIYKVATTGSWQAVYPAGRTFGASALSKINSNTATSFGNGKPSTSNAVTFPTVDSAKYLLRTKELKNYNAYGQAQTAVSCVNKADCIATTTSYHNIHDSGDGWLLGLPASEKSFGSALDGSAHTAQGGLRDISASRWSYNTDNTHKVKQQERYVCYKAADCSIDMTSKDIWSGSDSDGWQTVFNYANYDDLGRITSKATPTPQVKYGVYGAYHDLTYQYWEYVTGEVNPLGNVSKKDQARQFVTSYRYDYYGRKVQTTGINGRVDKTYYFPFGQLSKRTEAYGTALATSTYYTYHTPDSEDSGLYVDSCRYFTNKTFKETCSRQYANAFGEQYKTQSPGFDGLNSKTIERTSQVTFENGKQQISRSLPYFSDDSPGGELVKTLNTLGQGSQIQLRDNATSDTVYAQTTLTPGTVYGFVTLTKTDKQGASTKYYYDQFERVAKVEDAKGNFTRYRYDRMGRLLCVTLPGSSTVISSCDSSNYDPAYDTVMAYNSTGQQILLINPEQGQTSYLYYPNGKLSSKTDALGNITTYQYDDFGRTKSVRNHDAELNKTTASYTYYDSVVDVSNFKTDKVTMGQIGQITSTLDTTGNGNVRTYYSYDAKGRISGQYTSLYRGRFPTTIYAWMELQDYDLHGTATTIAYSDGSKWHADVDFGSGLIKAVSLSAADGSTFDVATYTSYNAAGKPLLMAQKNAANSNLLNSGYQYHPVTGLLQNKTATSEIFSVQDLTYDFDSVGNLKSIVDNRDYRQITADSEALLDADQSRSFGYDPLYRLTDYGVGVNVTPTADVFGYDALGNIESKRGQSFDYSDFVKTDKTSRTITGSADNGQNYHASYNQLGQLTEKTQQGTSWQYQYKPMQQNVASVTRDGALAASFIYDGAGQRISKIAYNPSGTSEHHIYPMDNIDLIQKADGTVQYQFHVNGAGNEPLMTFTSEGSTLNISELPKAIWQTALATVNVDVLDDKAGLSCHMETYQEAGEVISKMPFVKVGAINVPIVIKGQGMVDKQREVCQLTHLPGSKVHQDKAQSVTYYVNDHLGSTSLVLDRYGAVAGYYSYHPYGEHDTGKSRGTDVTDKQFTGQRRDESIGLNYYNARYYDPFSARFTTADTLVPNPYDLQSFNRYAYVLNNPVKYTDPTGHVPHWKDPADKDSEAEINFSDRSAHDERERYKTSNNLSGGNLWDSIVNFYNVATSSMKKAWRSTRYSLTFNLGFGPSDANVEYTYKVLDQKLQDALDTGDYQAAKFYRKKINQFTDMNNNPEVSFGKEISFFYGTESGTPGCNVGSGCEALGYDINDYEAQGADAGVSAGIEATVKPLDALNGDDVGNSVPVVSIPRIGEFSYGTAVENGEVTAISISLSLGGVGSAINRNSAGDTFGVMRSDQIKRVKLPRGFDNGYRIRPSPWRPIE